MELASIPLDRAGSRQLTMMQQAFVDHLLSNGGDKTKAAIDAGYSPTHADTQACELVRKPHIMQAIVDGSVQQLIAAAPRAIARLIGLTQARSEYVALQAAQDVLNRLGIKAPDRHDVRVAGDIQVNIDLGGSKNG